MYRVTQHAPDIFRHAGSGFPGNGQEIVFLGARPGLAILGGNAETIVIAAVRATTVPKVTQEQDTGACPHQRGDALVFGLRTPVFTPALSPGYCHRRTVVVGEIIHSKHGRHTDGRKRPLPGVKSIIDMPTLDWEISTIATSEPQHIKCARQLAAAGCSINVIVGTPFGWAGHSDIIAARERNERISALEIWQASQIAMA